MHPIRFVSIFLSAFSFNIAGVNPMLNKIYRLVFLCFLLAAAFLAVQPTNAQDKSSYSSTPEERKASANGEGSYQIGKGDILEIHVWKEPDLAAETFVRMDGMISLPLLNDIRAAGRTPMQLTKDIEKRLNEFVENATVTVIVQEPTSQKFYILGEVAQTGEYPLIKNLTVLQAFALAGGFTEWASKKEIILLRHEEGKDKIIRVNYKNIAKGKDLSQNILIQADDTIIVP